MPTKVDGSLGVDKIKDNTVTPEDMVQKMTLMNAHTFTGTETFKDFTGIPSWAKRFTIMFSGVSTNGSSLVIVQLGDAGGVENAGYISKGGYVISGSSVAVSAITNGIAIDNFVSAGDTRTGNVTICTISQNSYIASYLGEHSGASLALALGTSSKTLSDVLDRIRITTVNGTDTFDAGTVNVMYEG